MRNLILSFVCGSAVAACGVGVADLAEPSVGKKAQQKATIRETLLSLPTYPFSDPDPVPTADPGRYPYFRYGMRRKPSANGVEQDYRCRLNAADDLLRERFGLRPGLFSMIGRLPHHNVDAYCRQDMLDCYDCFRGEIESQLGFPFRNPKLIQRAVYAGYALAKGHGHFRRATFNTNCASAWWRRLLPAWADSLQIVPGTWRSGLSAIERFKPMLVCFNDGPATTDDDFAWLYGYLTDMF